MTELFRPTSGQGLVRSFAILICLIVGLSGCSSSALSTTQVMPEVGWRIVSVEGQPLESTLPSLHPETQEYLEAFAATVPEHLPELAYVSSVMLNPISQPSSDTLVVSRTDGSASVQIGVANVGSNLSQPNVLCLRNSIQVGCALEADVWNVTLPPKTIALLQTQIPVETGDRLDFLILAQDEPKRPEPASQLNWVFVEQAPAFPSSWLDTVPHTQLFAGCDFAIFIKSANNADASANAHFRSAPISRGTVIYLLIQLCEVSEGEYVRLIPIVDRTRVADLPGEIWHSAVRLTDKASVIAIDTAELGDAHEFQVAIVPLTDEAAQTFHHHNFTQAIVFSEEK